MPLVWLIVGVALAVAEAFTTTFVLIMFATGAFAAAGAAALGAGVGVQALVFAAVSTLALVVARPVVRRHLHRPDSQAPTAVAAIEGSRALVLEQVDADHGLVKIEGEMWRARPYDAHQVIPAGEQVSVVEIKGATAMVWRD